MAQKSYDHCSGLSMWRGPQSSILYKELLDVDIHVYARAWTLIIFLCLRPGVDNHPTGRSSQEKRGCYESNRYVKGGYF